MYVTAKDSLEKKTELENLIVEAIAEYELDTYHNVVDIHISRVTSGYGTDSESVTISVKAQVEL